MVGKNGVPLALEGAFDMNAEQQAIYPKLTHCCKGEDNSPASFEKALSNLSRKITQTANRLDSTRQQARRFKALWTLYTTFAYLLYSIILALVLGWQNWGIVEYAAVLGGPVVCAQQPLLKRRDC